MNTYTVKTGSYKGYPTLSILAEGRPDPVIRFGLRKARAIYACVTAIEEFIDKNVSEQKEP